MIRTQDGKLLLSFHKQFQSEEPIYKRIDDFYDGSAGDLISAGYLNRHESEQANNELARRSWANRCAITYYSNEIEPHIAVHVGNLAQEIDFGDLAKNSTFERIIEDVTAFGKSAKELHQDKVKSLCKYGRYGVLVDGPSNVSPSKQDAQENGERSYQVLYTARQIKDWEHVTEGPRLGYLKSLVVDAPPGVNEKGEEVSRWYWFTLVPSEVQGGEPSYRYQRATLELDGDETKKFQAENKTNELVVKLIASKPGEFDYIPFEIVGCGLEDSASMKAATEEAIGLFNEGSELSSINNYQAFQRVVFTGTTGDKVGVLAEHTAIVIPEADAKMHIIPAGQSTALEASIGRRENKIKRLILRQFNRMAAEDSKAVESAESKAQDQKALIAWYNSHLDKIQKSENRLWAYHGDFEGVEVEPQISILRDFELEDPTVISAQRGILFSQAGALGRVELQNELVNQQIDEMDIEDERKEELKQEKPKIMEPRDPLSRRSPIAEQVNKGEKTQGKE